MPDPSPAQKRGAPSPPPPRQSPALASCSKSSPVEQKLGDVYDGGSGSLSVSPGLAGRVGRRLQFQRAPGGAGLFREEEGFATGSPGLGQGALLLGACGGGCKREILFGAVDLEEDDGQEDNEEAFGKAALLCGVVAPHL